MRYCRFQLNGEAHYGLVESVAGRDAIVRILLTAPEEADGDMESLRTRRIDAIALEEAVLLPPVRPSKIVCIGRNYREHAAELGHGVPQEPLIFLKATSALLAPGGVVRRPKISERVDYEGELGVVIGKTCHQPPADADIRQYILGYTCVNDVTARDLQTKDGQWSRAKGFDTFCPVGPVV
ncbi:MAG TPA: fumarylacetoacetate hydrolase family protein, partial [Candidatus Sulfotelmatobacter sp.]|nr:fumarylacetoacetate hydrolase family protein [Candidatus Sulfotelmatobacter sp.]